MPTLNYTTSVPVVRTVAEVQGMLVKHGAHAVTVRYVDGRPAGLSFNLVTPHGERAFTLPVDTAAVHRLLLTQIRNGEITRQKSQYATPEHAARVAWRVVKDWLAAQLAIIEAGMAALDQVMLPYLQVDNELTLYDRYREHEQRALMVGAP